MWGPPVRPFGQPNRTGSVLTEPPYSPPISLTRATIPMASESPVPPPPCVGRLRPAPASPSPPKHSPPSTWPSHQGNRAKVLDCVLTHPLWIR
jgi:hypothetical protein